MIKNPRNPNTHPPKQIQLLSNILQKQGWRAPIVVSKRSGYIVKGHGRLEAGILAGFTEVPVDYQDYLTEADEWADMIADNKIAELAEIENDTLKDLLEELDTGEIDISLTGFDEEELGLLMSQIHQEDEDDILEDSSECPDIAELLDDQFSNELIAEVQSTDIHSNLKDFLIRCALRHVNYNYKKIAIFYNHQNELVKRFMRNSSLVDAGSNEQLVDTYRKMKSQQPCKIQGVGLSSG